MTDPTRALGDAALNDALCDMRRKARRAAETKDLMLLSCDEAAMLCIHLDAHFAAVEAVGAAALAGRGGAQGGGSS